MEIGVFHGSSVGPAPREEAEPLRFHRDLEIGIAADAAGFDTFWAPEHHCLEDYSHCSASHLMCLAVGMRTKRIRLCTGIFNICPPINHPVRVAEQIALIDILTDGRIELGTGRGSGSTEVSTFGLRNEDTREMLEEAIRAIPKMWTQDLFSWEGKYFSVPERAILPKPVQKPHPPLWVTATNPGTVERAAQLGLGVAMFSFSDPAVLEPLVEIYKKTIVNAEPVGEFVNDKVMTICPALCTEDGDVARNHYRENGASSAPYFSVYFDTIPDNAKSLADETQPIPQSRLREIIRERKEGDPLAGAPMAVADTMTPEFCLENGICVGTPDEVLNVMKRFEAVGFDQLVTVPAIGFQRGEGEHERTLESIRLMGEHVLPTLQGK